MSSDCASCDPICIKVPAVIGTGECFVVTATTTMFTGSPPPDETAPKRVTKTVIVDNAFINCGRVLIDGHVHKNVEYQAVNGMLGSLKIDVPFNCCIGVAGALAGDFFQTEVAEVVVEEDVITLPGPGVTAPPSLFEKMCVHVCGKVLRTVQITVNRLTGTADICPACTPACD